VKRKGTGTGGEGPAPIQRVAVVLGDGMWEGISRV
jgi:hypothetical protein